MHEHKHNSHDHKHNSHHHKHHNSHHKHDSKDTKKSDRCLEADYQVCKSWTKRRLLHAQRCCSNKRKQVEAAHPRSCENFGKKRCKKIQSILKCCIKTVYVEPSSVAPSNETTIAPGEESATKSEDETQQQQRTTPAISGIVCCKPVDEGILMECRFGNIQRCEEGEYQESNPSEMKWENLPWRNQQTSEGENLLQSVKPCQSVLWQKLPSEDTTRLKNPSEVVWWR